MERQLYRAVSDWMDAHREDMIRDIMRLVSIGSISDPESSDGPFGTECRKCMDTMLEIGREHGFYTENYDYYVGSIGSRVKNWDNMIGFWNHLDVVPVGNGWDYEPFAPTLKECFIIGRGSQDNKGPAIGILYMMQCLRELQIPLKHELCLFVGSDEERGMSDLEYYVKKYPTPRMSMIADSGFPVCYGEKGIMEGRMRLNSALPAMVLDCGGGSAGNMIPDMAFVLLKRTDGLAEEVSKLSLPDVEAEMTKDTVRLTVRGTSRHSAFPEGSVNAVYKLGELVASMGSVDAETRKLFESIAYLSEEYYGKHFTMEYQDEVSGHTTCAATIMKCRGGSLTLHFNIRYAITDEPARLLKRMSETARKCGMTWELERDSAPNYFPREHPAVDILTNLYNEITGERKQSFVMGGGTYARKLPNAFAYGVGGMRESEEDRALRARLFRPGHGGAHEPDEGLNVRLLSEAMKIYAMAVVSLNDCIL